jgi:hypothetical protein
MIDIAIPIKTNILRRAERLAIDGARINGGVRGPHMTFAGTAVSSRHSVR